MIYRDLPASQRSLPNAYRLGTGDPTKEKVSGQWRRWADTYGWQVRAAAYDQHLDAVRRTAAETVIAEVEAQRVRQIEMSAQATLKEIASLAHSNIADVMTWDEQGNVTMKPLSDLPSHVTAAIAKVKVAHDKQGNPTLEVEMHPKVRPLDLLGQHYSLWDSEKKQQEKAATNTFLELLNAVKSGEFKEAIKQLGFENASVLNPPPGITIELEAALIPPQMEEMEEGDV
jgi:hypothetical protein